MPGTFVDDSSKYMGVVALIVSGIGVFIAAVFAMYTYWVVIMGVFWILIGLGLMYGVVKATCTIDELTQQLRIATVRAYCFAGGETVYPLANVQGAELQTTIGRRGKTLYRVAIHTTTGPITWSSAWSNVGVDSKSAFVQSFNQYLSTVRGGAPILLPGAAQVNVVVVAGGSGAQIAQNVPLLGAQQNPPMQQYIAYNPQAMQQQQQAQGQYQQQAYQHPYQQAQGQYQQPPGQYPGFTGALPPQNAQPPMTTGGVAATNPYAVQPNPSAPPPPYSAGTH